MPFKKKDPKPSKKIQKYVKKVAKAIVSNNIEDKYFRILIDSTTTLDAATPTNGQIFNVPQSTGVAGDSVRIGDTVMLKSCTAKLVLSMFNQAVAPTFPDYSETATFRIMVVQDKSYNTLASITLAQLLLPSAYGGVNVDSLRNQDHLQTLVVLWDKSYTLSQIAGGIQEKLIDIHVPMKYATKKVQYAGGSTTNVTNGLFLVILTNYSAAHPSKANIKGNFKMTFQDA